MKSKTLCLHLIFLCILLLIQSPIFAQFNPNCRNGQDQVTGELCQNVLLTGVFFTNYPPDARSIGMGGTGIATEPGLSSVNRNSSNLAFIDSQLGVSLTYVPWLRHNVDGYNLGNVAAYYNIDNANVVAGSFRYFGLSDINFTDIDGKPYEEKRFELEALVAYNRKFNERFAAGLSVKYLYSKLVSIKPDPAQDAPFLNLAQSLAVDLSATYRETLNLGTKKLKWMTGIAITNIGPKLHYLEVNTPDWSLSLPTNLGLGTGMTMEFTKDHSLTISADVNRLLIPTPSNDRSKGDPRALDHKEKNFIEGILGSFTDAPNGPAEEFNENLYNIGIEYHYKMLYLRHGYYLEHATKGNRKFMCNGIGLKAFGVGVDFSYMLPLSELPVPETYRVTLSSDFSFKKGK